MVDGVRRGVRHRLRALAALVLTGAVVATACSATPSSTPAPPSSPTGSAGGPAGVPATGGVGTTAPIAATDLHIVEFAELGMPSFSIHTVSAARDGSVWFVAGAVGTTCLERFDPRTGGLTGETEPVDSVATADDGSVWYTNGDVVRRAATGGTQRTTLTGSVAAADVTRLVGTDRSSGAWVTETDADAVAHIDATGHVDEYTDGIPKGAAPGSISVGPDGDAWFAEPDAHAIGRVAPGGTVVQTDAGVGAPELVAADGAGAWFFDTDTQTFGRVLRDGSVRRFPDQRPVEHKVTDLISGSNGDAWFTEESANIGRVDPEGTVEEIPVDATVSGPPGAPIPVAPFNHPRSIAVDRDGTIWFTNYFYGGEGSRIALYAAYTGSPRPEWPHPLPLVRPIGQGVTCDGTDPAVDHASSTTTTDPATTSPAEPSTVQSPTSFPPTTDR